MPYTVANLKSDLEAIVHGTNLYKVTNLTELINRGARDVLTDVDPQETIRIEQINTPIFSDVFDYALPADIKGNKVIDIRPQVDRTLSENVTQTYSENFDLYKTRENFTIEFDSGTKYLRINKNIVTPIQIHNMDTIDDNGTWAVGDDAQNLAVDTLFKVQGSASLKFDLDGSTTAGYIENSTFVAKDLTEHENVSSLFLYVYFPDSSIVTSVDLRWGDNTTNFWNVTSTTPHNQTSFQNGWNLMRFDWNGATETGAPDASSVNYARVTINYDGTADTDIRVDIITSNIGEIYDIVYYSRFLFSNASGTFIEETTTDTDTVNLATETYDLLLYKIAELAAQQIQAQDSAFDVNYFIQKYELFLSRYKAQYKSQLEKPQLPYYRMPNRIRRRRFIGN